MNHLCIRCRLYIFTRISLRNLSCTSSTLRKPPWLPKAKSKIFVVPDYGPVIPEETELLREKFSYYRTFTSSLQSFLKSQLGKYEKSEALAEDKEAELSLDDPDFLMRSKINSEWNEQVSRIRESRVAMSELLKRRRRTLQSLKIKLQEEEQRRRADEEIVAKIEASKSFITPENLDERLELSLNQTTNYDFALDSAGRVWKNRILVGDLKSRETIDHNFNRDISYQNIERIDADANKDID